MLSQLFVFRNLFTNFKETINIGTLDSSTADLDKAHSHASLSIVRNDVTPLSLQRVRSARKTPSFTTRRSHPMKNVEWKDYGSIDMHGHLDRKQSLQVNTLYYYI